MAWVRHANRHIHHTVLSHVDAQLAALGWGSVSTLPFGSGNADVVTFIDTPAISPDFQLANTIKPGVIACTIGDEPAPEPEEVGGPLTLQAYPIFFDVFQKTHSSALALASDIRDILLGRPPGCTRFLTPINQVDNTQIQDWLIELDDVERLAPPHKFPLHWQVIKVTASTYFPEVIYG